VVPPKRRSAAQVQDAAEKYEMAARGLKKLEARKRALLAEIEIQQENLEATKVASVITKLPAHHSTHQSTKDIAMTVNSEVNDIPSDDGFAPMAVDSGEDEDENGELVYDTDGSAVLATHKVVHNLDSCLPC